MAPATDSQTVEPAGLTLKWSRGLSLTARILAVNLFAVILLGGGLFFLDSYRARLTQDRRTNAAAQASFVARSLPLIRTEARSAFLVNMGGQYASRLRVYDRDGAKIMDSFEAGPPTYKIGDIDDERWDKRAARWIDMLFDFVVRAPQRTVFKEPAVDIASAWPELSHISQAAPKSMERAAPDLAPIISGGAKSPGNSFYVLSTSNADDIRTHVRAERFNIAIFFLFVFVISALLSFFLARTIVRPLRHLARAAVKVRLGRAREVMVPRLPSRRDEIGMLARALSDMSHALRHRIDATEAFAADVAHEIKNPLASLRSALDGLDHVTDTGLRSQLMDVAKADVLRMDRLISDISEASRLDSRLSKSKFERIDLGDMIDQMLLAREGRNADGDFKIAFAKPRRGLAVVMGEDVRLERVLTNLIDNAVSFSPPNSVVEISATTADQDVIIRIIDSGPGIAESEHEAIFQRFHSVRPPGETFGEHSGLGLAIARTIIEGHQGEIRVAKREDGNQGACFEIILPLAEPVAR